MRILITGSNGLLGQKLVNKISSFAGHQIIATGIGPCRLENFPSNAIYSICDVTQKEEVSEVFQTYQPDVVIHTAAMTNVDECELNPEKCQLLNVTATLNVVLACETAGAHLIHLSTDFIFDGTQGPYIEEDLPNPISIYGTSKLDAEALVQNASCPWSIIRTILVYGVAPGLSRSNIILWVKQSLEAGKEIQVVDDQFRTPTLAEDLAMGCILVATQKATGIYNIAGKDFLTPYEMADQTADFFGLNKNLIKRANSSTFTQPARRPPRTGLDISKAAKLLGYQPHSFKEGIEILAAFLKM